MKYYKYMKREFVQRFLKGESIRIGTLHDFRNSEYYGNEVGDQREGVREIFVNDPVISSDIKESIPPIVKSFLPGFENSKRGMFFECSFISQENSEDIYILSLATRFDIKTMLDLGYDCCVEITNLDKFVLNITKKLMLKDLSTGRTHRGACIYGERRTNSWDEEKIPPWSLKERTHEYQREYRIAWEPTKQILEPINISCTSVRKYLEIKYPRYIGSEF